MRLCRKPVRKYDVGAPTAITISLPGTDPHDAERRRQIALKALSERLSKVDQSTSWPTLEDENNPKQETTANLNAAPTSAPSVPSSVNASSADESPMHSNSSVTVNIEPQAPPLKSI